MQRLHCCRYKDVLVSLDCQDAASGYSGQPLLRVICPPEPWRRLRAQRGNRSSVRVSSSLRAQRGNPVLSYNHNQGVGFLDCFVVSLRAKTSGRSMKGM